MNKKKLILCYVLQILAVATMCITILPIIDTKGNGSMTVFELVLKVGECTFWPV